MKPLRVLSPIKPGELCWAKVDDEWWLVRAEEYEHCRDCCARGRGICHLFPCDDFNVHFIRVNPIPMQEDGTMGAGEIYTDGSSVWHVLPDDVVRIGPPED